MALRSARRRRLHWVSAPLPRAPRPSLRLSPVPTLVWPPATGLDSPSGPEQVGLRWGGPCSAPRGDVGWSHQAPSLPASLPTVMCPEPCHPRELCSPSCRGRAAHPPGASCRGGGSSWTQSSPALLALMSQSPGQGQSGSEDGERRTREPHGRVADGGLGALEEGRALPQKPEGLAGLLLQLREDALGEAGPGAAGRRAGGGHRPGPGEGLRLTRALRIIHMSFLANVALSPDQPRAVAMWHRVSRQTWGTEWLSPSVGCGSRAGRGRRAGAPRRVGDAPVRGPLPTADRAPAPSLASHLGHVGVPVLQVEHQEHDQVEHVVLQGEGKEAPLDLG